MTIKAGCVPALSPDGKLIAFSTDKEMGVFDAVAGRVLSVRKSRRFKFRRWRSARTGSASPARIRSPVRLGCRQR